MLAWSRVTHSGQFSRIGRMIACLGLQLMGIGALPSGFAKFRLSPKRVIAWGVHEVIVM